VFQITWFICDALEHCPVRGFNIWCVLLHIKGLSLAESFTRLLVEL
jgi:hypothetical protein